MKHNLPSLPPRLHSATLAAADNLTVIAHSEDVQLTEPNGAAKDSLVTILYIFREQVAQTERQSQPYLGDELITPADIASVLETIANALVSDGTIELAGHNPSWYSDAATVIERLAQKLDQ